MSLETGLHTPNLQDYPHRFQTNEKADDLRAQVEAERIQQQLDETTAEKDDEVAESSEK